MSTGLLARASRAYQTIVEPVLIHRRRAERLARFDLATDAVPTIPIDWRQPDLCDRPCPVPPDARPRLLWRYALARRPLMPMVLDLAALADRTALDSLLKRRSSRTLPKLRKAARSGYEASRFPIEAHVHDVHAIRTSLAVRTAGPVLDYWLLRPEHIATPANGPAMLHQPTCPVHWIDWWGVFLPEPGHTQNGVDVGRRLVAFAKLTRLGEVVHVTEIMGHGDHLDANVMLLLHHAIAAWLIDGAIPMSRGARVLLYGALEHGRPGLLQWKKQAGFSPVRFEVKV